LKVKMIERCPKHAYFKAAIPMTLFGKLMHAKWKWEVGRVSSWLPLQKLVLSLSGMDSQESASPFLKKEL
jgi:hypothetical protein